MFEQDYIVRQIKECVAAAMKLLFGLDTNNPASIEFQNMEKKALSDQLITEIDKGNIRNIISNLHLYTLDKTKDDLLIAMIVYSRICDKNDDFLDSCSIDFSEIKENAKNYFSEFGLSSVSDVIFFD